MDNQLPEHSTSLRDRDLTQWLENKLGAVEEHWNSRTTAVGLLSAEILENLGSCFLDLQTHVKLRILIGIMHLSKRNLDMWRDSIENLLSLACQDTDDWVQTTADLLRDFYTTGGFNFSPINESGQFPKTLAELRKIVRNRAKKGELTLLPSESASCSKNCVDSVWGAVPSPPAHFQLKRRPKSATVRAELIQKSNDAALQGKAKTTGGSLSSVVPIRARKNTKKMDNNSPLRGLPTQNALKSSVGFGDSKSFNQRPSAAVKRDGGVKFIEIQETPEALKKKRKILEAEQKVQRQKDKEIAKVRAAEEREARKVAAQQRIEENKREAEKVKAARAARAAAVQRGEGNMDSEDSSEEADLDSPSRAQGSQYQPPPRLHHNFMPDYAAGLVGPSSDIQGSGAQQRVQVPGAVPGYHVGLQGPTRGVPSGITVRPMQDSGRPGFSQQVSSQQQSSGHQPPNIRGAYYPLAPSGAPIGTNDLSTNQQRVPPVGAGFYRPTIPGGFSSGSEQSSQSATGSGARTGVPPAANQLTPGQTYTITKEVMQEAQDMFREANKLSRPEKALILGFMAGNRDNPCPQMGQVLTVRLSEMEEPQRNLVTETFFQMNYETGEWKRLRKSKHLNTTDE